jgi:hypothetical protein
MNVFKLTFFLKKKTLTHTKMSCLPIGAEEVVWQTPSLTTNFLLKYQL